MHEYLRNNFVHHLNIQVNTFLALDEFFDCNQYVRKDNICKLLFSIYCIPVKSTMPVIFFISDQSSSECGDTIHAQIQMNYPMSAKQQSGGKLKGH